MLSEHDRKFALQVDSTIREIIVLLLQRGIRLTPDVIERVRTFVVAGFFEAARLAIAQDAGRRRQRQVDGPWDDEITEPERPSNRPKKL